MSLLVLENIVKEYKAKTILSGVSLKVDAGEKLALIGPNGSGKSTLIKIAIGQETCDSGTVSKASGIKIGYISQGLDEVYGMEGRTALDYEKVLNLERKIRENEVKLGSISGSSDEAEALLREYSKLMASYEAMDGYNAEVKIKKILSGLGLREEAMTEPVEVLSGGEKMRVAMSRMLLEEPDLLILDEPTNHLDIDAIEWFEDYLKKFNGGILVVSHDRYFLNSVASRVAELENGTITERAGNYSTFMDQKKVIDDFLQREKKGLEIQVRREEKIVQNLRSMRRINAFQSRKAMMEKRKDEISSKITEMKQGQHLHKQNAPKINFTRIEHTSKDIAEVKGLYKSFGTAKIFSNASFEIKGGERIGVIGPNGCGKTTLINILLGHDSDYKGFVRLGEWVKYSYMGQDILFEDEDRTIAGEIISKREMIFPDALKYLSRFQFYGDDCSKQIKVLSGGERVRLFLACIMLEESTCLIMDEPTNHLDVTAREALEEALKDYKGTVIAVTHDRYFLNNCVTRILEVEDERINSYPGNYDEYKRSKEMESNMSQKASCSTDSKSGRMKQSSGNKTAAGTDVQDPGEIEKQIEKLEDEVRVMEQSFNKATSSESYRVYNEKLNEIEKLYSVWK